MSRRSEHGGGEASISREVLDALQEEEDNIKKRFGKYLGIQAVEGVTNGENTTEQETEGQ